MTDLSPKEKEFIAIAIMRVDLHNHFLTDMIESLQRGAKAYQVPWPRAIDLIIEHTAYTGFGYKRESLEDPS